MRIKLLSDWKKPSGRTVKIGGIVNVSKAQGDKMIADGTGELVDNKPPPRAVE